MPIPDRVRYFNKRVLNRVMIRIAGVPLSPIAILRHTGRRSGKTYAIPVIVEPTAGGFVFALTYGTHVDWYRNVLAAGQCGLRWHGRDYTLEKPQPLGPREALSAFPLPFRPMLRLVGVNDFLRMSVRQA